jgi:hypothetical protein
LALISTGIGAILVAVGLLIANFDKVTGAVKNVSDWFTNLGEKTKLVLSIIFPFIGAIRLVYAGLEKMGIIQTEQAEKAAAAVEKQQEAMMKLQEQKRKDIENALADNKRMQSSIDKTYDFEIAKAKAAGKDVYELEKEKRAEMRKTLEAQIVLLEESLRLNSTSATEMMRIIKEMAAVRSAITQSEQEDQLASIKKSTDERKKADDAAVKAEEQRVDAAAKQLERERLLRDYFIKSIADDDVRALVQLQENHKREEEELIKKYGKESDVHKALKKQQKAERLKLEQEWIDAQTKIRTDAQIKEAERERAGAKAGLELKLLGLQEDWAAELEVKKMLWKIEHDEALKNTDLTENEKLLIKAKYDQNIIEATKDRKAKEFELEKKAQEAVNEIIANGMNSIQGLSDAIFSTRLANAEKGSKEELKIQKRQFELNKAMQLGTAIINGVQSILAITSVPDFTLGVQTALRIGAQVALNAASIAKIAATRFEGGAPSPFTPPEIPQVGAPDTTNAQPQAQGTQTAGLVNQRNKVVVVDSEIKAVMDSSQQIEVVSSFGG